MQTGERMCTNLDCTLVVLHTGACSDGSCLKVERVL